VLLDANQRVDRLMKFINIAGKSGFINVEPIIAEIAALSGLDPAMVMTKPNPPQPEAANISLRLSGMEDLSSPLVVAMLMKEGKMPSEQEIQAAKLLLADVMAPVTPVAPQAPPAGPAGPNEDWGPMERVPGSEASMAGDDGGDISGGDEATLASSDGEEGTDGTEEEGQVALGEAAAQPEGDEFSQFKRGIPHKRVKDMIARAEAKAKSTFEAQVADLNSKLAPYQEPQFQAQQQAMTLANENPEKLLQLLAQADDRYGQMLGRLFEEQAAPPQSQQPTTVEGDILLNDGTYGYSPAQVQRALDQRAQAVEAAIERKMSERFGPMEKAYQSHQLYQGAASKAEAQITEASKWPGFVENQNDILTALQADQKLTLHDAYIRVVVPKLTAGKDDVRKQVLAEINAKPRAASGSLAPKSGVAAPTASAGPRDTEDVIKEALRAKDLMK
jgi:hypothetical protein